MSWSISSPPIRIERLTTMPPREMTATSVVPPPMSTMSDPDGSLTGRPAPMAAAIGSSIESSPPGMGVEGRVTDRSLLDLGDP